MPSLSDLRNNPKVVEFARRHPKLLAPIRRNKKLYDAVAGHRFTAPMAEAGTLERYFRTNSGRLISKWHHYFSVYDRHLAPFRNHPVTVVEFGVFHGGSLQMWKDYFGPGARIIGVDINPACAELAEEQIEIVIGDQEDREFLRKLAAEVGPVDVLIEDGGHMMAQQINTFEEFWPHIVDGGIFLIEDLHTSYWEDFGGGYKKPGTFIEYAKDLIDRMHAWHSRESGFDADDYTRSIQGMHVYDSIIVFDKADVRSPRKSTTGTPSFPID